MKFYNKTLQELEFKLNLSQVGTCSSCHAAEFHGTKEYAKQAVTQHRAISRDIRNSINDLIKHLDRYDAEVERYHSKVVELKLGS